MSKYNTPSGFKVVTYGIAIFLAFLIMGYLVRRMQRLHDPGRVNSARAVERIKARENLATNSLEALTKAGWADQPKGLVRLPIDRAMELTVQAYQNPDAARSNWVARSQKAQQPVSFE